MPCPRYPGPVSIIYTIADLANSTLGYGIVRFFPAVFVAAVLVRQARRFRLDLSIVAMLLAAYPMLTPLAADLGGHHYFTALNYDLQGDTTLKVAAILLILLFCVAMWFGSRGTVSGKVSPYRVIFGEAALVPTALALLVLLTMYLEADFVLRAGYGEIKSVETPYSSLVNQAFNGFACVFLSYIGTDRRKRLVALIYAASFVIAVLMARRTLAIGIVVLALYSLGNTRFTVKGVLIIAGTIFLMVFLGIARSVGILDYLAGADAERIVYSSLPGGASNIFVGSMGVIDLWNRLHVPSEAWFPILQWPSGRLESDIYAQLGYQYNGGMHLANVLYWNFGLLGVGAGGFLVGRIARRCDALLLNLDLTGGTLPAMLAAVIAILLPNLLWYSPVGVLNLTVAIVVVYGLARLVGSPLVVRQARTA